MVQQGSKRKAGTLDFQNLDRNCSTGLGKLKESSTQCKKREMESEFHEVKLCQK